MNIASKFFDAADRYPNNIALIEKGKKITYSELKNDVLETAAYLSKKNIQKEDRVMVFIGISVDLYRTVLAIFHIGATAVFLDQWVDQKRLNACSKKAKCKGFIGPFKANIIKLYSKEIRRIPVKLKVSGRDKNVVEQVDMAEDDGALITFTTGSTGTPKAAFRSHGFLEEQFRALHDEIGSKPEDIDISNLPIVLFANLGIGCTSVIPDCNISNPRKFKPEKLSRQIREEGTNRITASPFYIMQMAEYLQKNNENLDQLKKLFTGGAPVFPKQAGKMLEAFPNSTFTVVYGSTEAEPISAIDAAELFNRRTELSYGLPVGKTYHKIELRIIKVDPEPIELNASTELSSLEVNEGEIGEIIVAGPHVLKKYYEDDLSFRKNKIVDRETIWHRTGDSGRIRNGELFLTGRSSELIETSNGYISPFIIENILQEIPGVTNGTLIAKDSMKIMFLETKVKEPELQDHLKGIEYDKLVLVDKIPLDPRHNSKIDYDKLRGMA